MPDLPSPSGNGQPVDHAERDAKAAEHDHHTELALKILAWIEHKAFGGEWKPAGGRTPIVFDIPDEEGFDVKVGTKCKEGVYHSGYEAVGRGPALPDNPSGNPFKHQDYGWTTRIFSAGDCKG